MAEMRNEVARALDILQADPIRNFSAIQLLRTLDSPQVVIRNKSILARGKEEDGDFILLAPQTEEDALALLGELAPGGSVFYIIEDWGIAQLIRSRPGLHHHDCHQLHLPDDIPLPEEDDPRIREIGAEWAGYIYEHYQFKEMLTFDYLEDRLQSGPVVGLFMEDTLAGWVFLHDEGTMGFLTVLPEYRRHGVATALTHSLSRRVREMGMLPVVHIGKTNQASLALAKSLGFVPNASVHWLTLV